MTVTCIIGLQLNLVQPSGLIGRFKYKPKHINFNDTRTGKYHKHKDKDKDQDLFIGPQEFIVGYSKGPEQPQSSARPVCQSHTMTSMGCEPTIICIAAYRSSLPGYALCH